MPDQEAQDNTLKTILLMEYGQKHKTPACLISVDAKKEFNRVKWDFLKATLQQIGLGQNMLHRSLALYHCP